MSRSTARRAITVWPFSRACRSPISRHASGAGSKDCRHVQARLPHGIVVHNFYVPSGGDVPDPQHNPKFAHKLRFLSETAAWFEAEPVGDKAVLVGDLNIAPLETDVWSHKQLTGVVSHTPMEVAHLARLQSASAWIDAVRHFVPASERLYTWWNYRARDWAAPRIAAAGSIMCGRLRRWGRRYAARR